MGEMIKKIPYGESNFKKVLTQNFLYIDKTRYIEELEQVGSYNLLLRPRRFGKSLFLSSLIYYYDLNRKEDFDSIFSDLYIGKNPTSLRSSYKVLFMNFSGIDTDSMDRVQYAFNEEVRRRTKSFLKNYGFSKEQQNRLDQPKTAADIFVLFTDIIQQERIFLIIDEYDHFANSILGDDLTLFKEVIGKGGFVRAFYETVKTATQEGIVERIFMTGVTSITMDSMTSGFNIMKNISHNKRFNSAIGFTRTEVESTIEPIVQRCDLNQDVLMNDLKSWYNGYLFNIDTRQTIYNSDMLLYFIQEFKQEKCEYPSNMLDSNIASDYGKIMQLFAIGNIEDNYQVLEDLIIEGKTVGVHQEKLDIAKGFNQADFLGLLYYMGFITITGKLELYNLVYTTPNYVIQQLYYDYFKVEIERRNQIKIDNRQLDHAIKEMALNNNLKPFHNVLENALVPLSNRDYQKMDEKHIKAIILTLLHQSPAYFIKSEMEQNNKYPDIMLLERSPFKVNYQFLLELKYSKKGDKQQGWERKKAEGLNQIEKYQQLPDIKNLPKLQSYLILTNSSEVNIIEV